MTVPKKRIKVAVKSNDICLRDPKTMERITTEGKMVTRDSFWIRRIKAGDCIILENPKQITNQHLGVE
jgi:hypothetical protein